MANVAQALELADFRHVQDIDSLDESQLKSHGYYKGYQCPHGHTIRDMQMHWCYHCVIKIKSNLCGFNLNFLNVDYKIKYHRLWAAIDVGASNECWKIKLPGKASPRRICFPSYRAYYSNRKSENVTPHKVIYQCAWGDVGAMVVTRVCGNPWCGNPLHMVSTWNIGMPPKHVQPMELEFKAEDLMLDSAAKRANRLNELLQRSHKQTILHPLCAKDAPYYDEG